MGPNGRTTKLIHRTYLFGAIWLVYGASAGCAPPDGDSNPSGDDDTTGDDDAGVVWPVSDHPEGLAEARGVSQIVNYGDELVVWSSGIESIVVNPDGAPWLIGPNFDTHSILRGEDRPVWLDDRLGDGAVGPYEPATSPGMYGNDVMYYTVADWDRDDGTACIGRATTAASDSLSSVHWVDDGSPVLCSTAASVQAGGPFAVDASVFTSPALEGEEKLWMSVGSHWSGIWIVELDSTTGHLPEEAGESWSETSPYFHLVAKGPQRDPEPEFEGGMIQASSVYYRQSGKFYLFLSWDQCGLGLDSTCNIHVGRSDVASGPYWDNNHELMSDRGGQQCLGDRGRFVGPGDPGVFYDNPNDRFLLSFHFNDSYNEGAATLGIRELRWTASGWPKVGRPIMPGFPTTSPSF